MGLPTVLLIGQGAIQTGFSRVMESLGKALSDNYKVHQLALQYAGSVLYIENYTIHPNNIPGDVFGINRLPSLLDEVSPDIVLILHDLWYFSLLADIFASAIKKPKIVAYSAIDNRIVNRQDISDLGFIDKYIVFTQFAKTTIEAAVQLETTNNASFVFPEILVIPHGVDFQSFYPLDKKNRTAGRLLAREKLFPGMQDKKTAFIVLNANRNQPRKRLDICMEGFAIFARNKPGNVYLLLHAGLKDVGIDIKLLANKLGIEDRIIYTSEQDYHPTLADEELNFIYNACDIGVNTSTAEGWGLVAFEHASTGAAQIVVDHTANTELWQHAALMPKPVNTQHDHIAGIERYETNAVNLAEALELLYADPDYLDEISEACYRNAVNEKYSWKRIAEQFDILFKSLLEEKK